MSILTKIAKMLDPQPYKQNELLLKTVRELQDDRDAFKGHTARLALIASDFGNALRRISSQRTSKCNATVRRICDIADAELKRGEG